MIGRKWILFALVWPALAGARAKDLDFNANFRVIPDPLTTEKIWKIDPQQLNPHLQRWILSRGLVFVEPKTVRLGKDRYGFQAKGIQAKVEAYVRGPGPWYRPFSEFSCEKQPDSWFATEEGTQAAASEAGELWMELLKIEKVKLSLLLGRIVAQYPQDAMHRAATTLEEWRREMDQTWRSKAEVKARVKEWKSYLERAKSENLCGAGKNKSGITPSWRTLLDPPTGQAPHVTQLLARAPARLWNGLFSIRVSVHIGGRVLNGRFLIDSELEQSVLSPDWLEGQGIPPAWVTVPRAIPKRINWGILREAVEGGLATRARVEKIEVGGLSLPLDDFLMHQTEFFSPPESVGTCCDGVLGRDFLRLYPMEFDSHAPAEVRIWPKENFSGSSETPWVVVSETSGGGVVSPCKVLSEQKSGSSKTSLSGVDWSTTSEYALLIHSPWAQVLGRGNADHWKISCDAFETGSDIHATRPESAVYQDSSQGSVFLKNPAVTLGMPFLSAGKFTFDLPHGRLWLSKEALQFAGPRKNTTGLSLRFDERKGDRILVVSGIEPKSRALQLSQSGLTKGSIVTQMDGKPVDEMDQWEVDRRLAGDYGETVTLQWQTKKGLGMGPLKVRSE